MKSLLHGLLVAVLLMACAPAFGEMNYNALGFKLLAELRHAEPQRNIFISPAGLGFALSMAADGAAGETAREMRAVMEQPGATDLDKDNRQLLDQLSKIDPSIKLEIANSLWVANDLPIKSSYVDALDQFYQARAETANFHDPSTVRKINDWVDSRTHGKISKIVDPPIDADKIILLDAVYFKGDWEKPFDKKLTSDQPFTLAGGQSVKCPRMTQTREILYHENDDFQAVSLPYSGRDISMIVILPKKSLNDFLPSLTTENWERWMTQFDSRKGTLELPRFKLENKYDLKAPLMNLGMHLAFTAKADFSGISAEPLYIDWIRQKTFVDVNEEGTEAAAVTGIGMRAMAVRIEPPPFHMVVDRPFIVAIREHKTGALLFLGAIMDPR